MEEIDYSVLFRWLVGLNLDEEVWDATTFTKNRDRLLEAEKGKQFLTQVVEQARAKGRGPVAVIRQLAERLELHRLRCGNPQSGPIFANTLVKPQCMNNLLSIRSRFFEP